jgi:hypothetical protein
MELVKTPFLTHSKDTFSDIESSWSVSWRGTVDVFSGSSTKPNE